MKLEKIEQIYHFNFDKEMKKMKKEMMETCENHKEYNKIRKVLCEIINNVKYKYQLDNCFDRNFIDFPNFEDNKINLVFALENFISLTHYNIVDDGEIYFIKSIETSEDNSVSNDYFFTTQNAIERKEWIENRLKLFKSHIFAIKSIEIEHLRINSVELFINILKEIMNENNYYFEDDDYYWDGEKYQLFDDDKAFAKFFEKRK